ncbi:zinc finger CCCH domain-containing protein 13-like isoform X1 [Glycine soja]|uniref:Zinc finger CCCH domain-containing protein 13 isoform A n=1 Tax=Glycine soja TaxID=3848 RepID=A0A445HNC8_GLYSO|nr:zinc finger CCCH domain-containing protein 13-like isoform X1 [Glycine soja]XP_028194499.1 zinc finger CCCH domain-containing protein 13-like isoform X1 [Glycine soja]XP_028194500.1 zinc finger CCCH domain-containing protein 13-like isoform X1 [Glycine soja]RZB75209.1 Zinc finger CCCH domain-containing protein 13 isoform A [Glycine soja]
MVERKQFKTKLCVLYQRGRCNRHNCSFAHGSADLRRFSASYSGRRDYLGNDLRDKLDRRYVSPQRYSPAPDTRGRQIIREYSPTMSLEKKSDRRHRRKQDTNGQSDISGNLKVSDRVQGQVKEGKLLSSGSRNNLEEQLKKVDSDISTLQNRKFQLEVYLDESVQEVDSLNSRIRELEAQLCKEDEECKRITSRIRKFVRVHNHMSELQDELRRSQVRLQRFGDQLVSDISRIGANEEDLSIDIISNGENTGLHPIAKHNVEHNDASSHKKRLHIEHDALEELKQDRSKDGHLVETARTRKRSRWNLSDQLKEESLGTPDNGTEVTRSLDLEGKHEKGLKQPRIEAPSTSMAAHVVDEDVDIERYDGNDINETANTENDNGAAYKVKGAPLMLPPALLPRSNYLQYEGNDENVDVDG